MINKLTVQFLDWFSINLSSTHIYITKFTANQNCLLNMQQI